MKIPLFFVVSFGLVQLFFASEVAKIVAEEAAKTVIQTIFAERASSFSLLQSQEIDGAVMRQGLPVERVPFSSSLPASPLVPLISFPEVRVEGRVLSSFSSLRMFESPLEWGREGQQSRRVGSLSALVSDQEDSLDNFLPSNGLDGGHPSSVKESLSSLREELLEQKILDEQCSPDRMDSILAQLKEKPIAIRLYGDITDLMLFQIQDSLKDNEDIEELWIEGVFSVESVAPLCEIISSLQKLRRLKLVGNFTLSEIMEKLCLSEEVMKRLCVDIQTVLSYSS
jgi:hypothetical protein